MAGWVMGEKAQLRVDSRTVPVSSLEKVLFPATGFTKAQLLDYYIRIAPVLLPHLKNRPLTLKLYFEEPGRKPQYIKDAPTYTPAWVKRAAIWRRDHSSKIHYVLVNDLPSLVWAANLNNIELHVFLARAPRIECPTAMVFDLDPGQPATVLHCARAALILRDRLADLGLRSFVKSSGSKGLHLWVPLNTSVNYEASLPFAKALAEDIEKREPSLVVTEMAKAARAGKVFIDYSQNADFKTTASVYSVRARPDGPFVSVPLGWEEVASAVRAENGDAFFRTPAEVLAAVEVGGDLFEPVLRLKQKLPGLNRIAGSAPGEGSSGTRLLRDYRAKRDFGQTREPAGNRTVSPKEAQLFVVQKHAASHLHYDFRLEMQGVLRSWAVPKGPPMSKGERRLAMHVEDHPLDYARFEGIIPKGQYGGGTVMVWDLGTYQVKDENPVQAYYAGTLHLTLAGKKLKGDWTLVRLKPKEGERDNSWLLIKSGADAPAIPASREARSVLTRRTMEQIAAEGDAVWQSHR